MQCLEFNGSSSVSMDEQSHRPSSATAMYMEEGVDGINLFILSFVALSVFYGGLCGSFFSSDRTLNNKCIQYNLEYKKSWRKQYSFT